MPERCTYIAGWLAEGGLSKNASVPKGWLFAEVAPHSNALEGLVYISVTGIVMPVLRSPDALDEISEMARINPNTVRVLVGDRQEIAALWSRLEKQGLEARIVRDQLGYSVDRDA